MCVRCFSLGGQRNPNFQLVKEMYVSRLTVQVKRIEEEKLKDKTRESKREIRDICNFLHSRSGGGNRY